MKVLFVSHQAKFIFGGEVVTREMIRGLRQSGVKAEFASPPGPYHDYMSEMAPTHRISSVEFSRKFLQLGVILRALWVATGELRELVTEQGFTHLHAQSLKAHVFCWWLGIAKAAKVIWHHHDIMPLTVANSLWLRVLALGAHQIVVPSHATRLGLEAAGVPEQKIQVVWNGFPLERWQVRPSGQLGGSFRVIFVGEISRRKGADLLPVISKLLGPGFEMQVVGEGLSDPEFAERVKSESQEMVASEQMCFLGRRSDVPALLQEAQVILVPSREDPLPTVVIEAALSGVPCVGTAVGGMRELVEDGGFLVRDAVEMAERIRWLADHPEEWRRMGLAARAFAEKRFSLTRVVQELTAIYSKD